MRVELLLQLRGERDRQVSVDRADVERALAAHDGVLHELTWERQRDTAELLIGLPPSADLEQVAADVGAALSLTHPAASWAVPEAFQRGTGGSGYTCAECGGVDSDHFPTCRRRRNA
ncbi:hypothetical protein ETD86_23675 [Nonomuraea turkmeniaca]|uniref:Uncharacterized protein n=1 Tax=Nonomuraea turkmeniaca TaxID=103838 RepID=A0A5S4FEK3_9ACTN|nr:hypothetical protein [Nonomuraea turkmeniaca]TMR17336.1 hypothetical protein ETD86_23675 [Nonomuraea turkmeniaca]